MLLSGLRWSGDGPGGGSRYEEARAPEAPPPKKREAGLGPIVKCRDGDEAGAVPSTDGGASYRAAALRRAIAQAESSGRKLEDVVAERWGSLEELTKGDPNAIDKALSSRPAARPAKKRRRQLEPSEAQDIRSTARTSADAAMLRQYARKVEDAISSVANGGSRRDSRSNHDVHSDSESNSQNAWVGLASRQTLGFGTGTFSHGWRKKS